MSSPTNLKTAVANSAPDVTSVEREIECRIRWINEALSELNGIAGALIDRLGPVLSDNHSDSECSPDPYTSTRLGQQLDGILNRIRAERNSLGEALRRLEV